jgi:hypothetical protein
MPIKTSGPLALIADIEAEFSQGDNNISLAQAGVDAGLNAGDLGMFEFYGLSDAVAPTVNTDSTASVNTVQMRVYGTVSSDGGGTITQRGFYFGTSAYYGYNTKYSVGGTTGSFNRLFTGLNSNTTYYYTAYAINSAGESIGPTRSQATAFNYTFKAPIHSQNFGYEGITGGVYYSNVNGGWSLRSSYNFGDSTCVSVPTNRQARSLCVPGGYGNYITIQKNGCCCSGAPTLTITGVSKVVGDYYSNGSSYLQCNGLGSGHDFRFTAT